MQGIAAKDRPCEACSACCHVYPIHEKAITKPEWAWCMHASLGSGCRIYPKRPPVCRNFVCWWKTGKGNLDDRPDLIGCLVDQMIVRTLGSTLIISETRSGAVEQSGFVRDMIQRAQHLKQAIWIRRERSPGTLYLHMGVSIAPELWKDIIIDSTEVIRYGS